MSAIKCNRDFVINVDQVNILILNVINKSLNLLVVLFVIKKGIFLENALKTKKDFIEKEGLVLDVVLLDILLKIVLKDILQLSLLTKNRSFDLFKYYYI